MLAPGATWPLVGRVEELERIVRARADSGCRGLVVSGGAGVGKSRLAREASRVAAQGGALVDWVQATKSAAAVPLGAFAGVVPDGVRSSDALALMRRSVESLAERADGRKVVIGVDDAQLLDPVSAALVLHLTVTGSAFIIATVRTGEPCPDAIVSLWKDAGALRMQLDPLDDAAVEELVETALGGPVEQGALRWIRESSQGNALYVRELVLGALDSGRLVFGPDLWRLSSPPPVSRSLMELVSERMADMTQEERAPLEVLALGEPLRVDEIVALSSTDSLVAAEERGMVVVQPPSAGAEVRLAHPLYGEVVRQGLRELRGRALRLGLAEQVGARDPLPVDDAVRVARWLLDAGAEIPAALLVDAARGALLAGDPDLGAQLAELAVTEGIGLDAVLLLARAHTVRKRFADAEAVLAAAEDGVVDHEGATEYLEQRVQVLFWGLDRPEEARDLLGRAQAWSGDPGWQRRLDPLRLALVAVIDGYAPSVDTLAGVLAEPDLDPVTRGMTERRLAVSLFFTGQTGEAARLTRDRLPRVPLTGYHDTLALGLWRLIGFESGEDWVGLEAYMTRVLRDAVRAQDHEAAGHGAFSLGYTAFLRGHLRDAARWFAEADLHFERHDTFGSLLHVRAMRVGVDFFSGDRDAALASRDLLRATLDGRSPRSSQMPYVARAEGWAARVAGDAEGAARLLAEAEALDEMPLYASQLVYEALRAGASARSLLARQERLAARSDARLAAAYLAHTRALAAKDGPGLLAVADEMEAIGALRYAMEAAVHAASTFADAGRDDSARRAASRAQDLHDPEQGGEAPRIPGLDPTAVVLTAREAQITDLARRGMTNAEIAQQLVLSVRTVEAHLYRAMHKLGVSDRRLL